MEYETTNQTVCFHLQLLEKANYAMIYFIIRVYIYIDLVPANHTPRGCSITSNGIKVPSKVRQQTYAVAIAVIRLLVLAASSLIFMKFNAVILFLLLVSAIQKFAENINIKCSL